METVILSLSVRLFLFLCVLLLCLIKVKSRMLPSMYLTKVSAISTFYDIVIRHFHDSWEFLRVPDNSHDVVFWRSIFIFLYHNNYAPISNIHVEYFFLVLIFASIFWSSFLVFLVILWFSFGAISDNHGWYYTTSFCDLFNFICALNASRSSSLLLPPPHISYMCKIPISYAMSAVALIL